MKKNFLLFFLFFITAVSSAQTVVINPANYLKKRVSQGLMEDGRIHRMNFADCKMKKIAVLYWPENTISKYKTGITIFENKQIEDTIDTQFKVFADSIIKQKFEQITTYKFTLIGNNPFIPIEKYFSKKKGFKPFSATEEGKVFLKSLTNEGFDGVLILYEDEIPDGISENYQNIIPPKGLYKKYGQNYVYHSIYSRVFDLNKGKPLKKIGYLQLSADFRSQKTEKHFKDQKIIDNPVLLNDLKFRFENNIDEIIKVFKLDKA